MPENFPLKTLSVFFPAYNEEDNIVNTVSKAINVLQSLNISDYEIIVVDDGSTDRTAAEVQNLAIKNSKIRLIRHNRNRGYGAALKTGFDFREINKFLVNVTDFQVIVGYRRKRSDSKFRRMMAVLLRIWDTILFGLKLRDVDCGFKLIKKSVINNPGSSMLFISKLCSIKRGPIAGTKMYPMKDRTNPYTIMKAE